MLLFFFFSQECSQTVIPQPLRAPPLVFNHSHCEEFFSLLFPNFPMLQTVTTMCCPCTVHFLLVEESILSLYRFLV